MRVQRRCAARVIPVIAAWALLAAPSAHAAIAGLHRLTATPGVRERAPAFVDGPRVAYLRAASGEPAWRDELWLAGANGAGARRVLGPGCFHLRVSHSRRLWVACSRYVDVRSVGPSEDPVGWEARTEAWAVPVGNPRPVRVAGPGAWFVDGWAGSGALHLHEGRLGYDGTRGFFEATGFPPLRACFALPWLGATLHPLTDARTVSRTSDRGDWPGLSDAGVWSPSGRECIRVRRFLRGGKPFVGYDLVRAGGPPKRLLESEEYAAPGPRAWLPAVVWLDSSRVLLQRFRGADAPRAPNGGAFALAIVHAGSGAARTFAPGVSPAAFPDPVLSPAGDRVLLRARGRDGSRELWVVSASGANPRRVLDGDADYTPWAWSPDGRSLVVSRGDTEEGDLWRIDVTGP